MQALQCFSVKQCMQEKSTERMEITCMTHMGLNYVTHMGLNYIGLNSTDHWWLHHH